MNKLIRISKIPSIDTAAGFFLRLLPGAFPCAFQGSFQAAALAAFADCDEYSKMNKKDAALFKTSDWRKLPGVSALTKERKTRDDAIQTLAELLKNATPNFD